MKAVGLFPCLLGIAACAPIGKTRQDDRKNGGASKEAAAVSIDSGSIHRPAEAKILVNQVGYFTCLAKIATLRSDAMQPLDWKLVASDGHEAAHGKSQPAGLDVPSGDKVHLIDFSAFKGSGRDFTLAVGGRAQPALRDRD
jgi:endoglucanase